MRSEGRGRKSEDEGQRRRRDTDDEHMKNTCYERGVWQIHEFHFTNPKDTH